MEPLSKVIACVLGLSGFAVACAVGLVVGNPGAATLSAATVAMLACYILGSLVGWAMQVVADEHVGRYESAHPVPRVPPIPTDAMVDAMQG